MERAGSAAASRSPARKRVRAQKKRVGAQKKRRPAPRTKPPSDGGEEARRARHLGMLAGKPLVERCLEELVFGGSQDAEEEELLQRLRGPGKQLDVVTGNLVKEDSSDSEVENEAEDNFPPSKKPAWVDDEDEAKETIDMTHRYRKDMMKSDAEEKLTKEKVQKRLQEQFQRAMGGVPFWAQKDTKKARKSANDDDSDEDELLRKTGNFLSASESLPRGILQMKNCLDANNERPSDAKLRTVQFHPSAQVVMTAGLDRSISLFQVDGKTNPKIQSIHLESFPVYKAHFSADGEQVIATGTRSKLFYVYDMMSGHIIPVNQIRGMQDKFIRKFEVSPDGSFLLLTGASGYLHLLTMKTKELIGSMKINGKAVASAFSPDSSKIYTHSNEGEVFIWDVKSRRCLNRFTDEGCLRGTCLAVSKNGQYVACGSCSGVVNVYTHDVCLRETNPKPVKAIMNLVTAATSLTFNPTTEILAVASSAADDAVRLVHIPSLTVFSNFPVFRRKLIYLAQTMDFSPRSGFFSIGNNKGTALLYRLKHYSDF
ncbi:U3 small nucleolar RNA-associated protein 18 homolog [Chelonoidis abingdonii]|uniref:U3 small nucleolar RNA-associated protein 18 homolog n=1 Tax=Chelonoidis abingdonii TaxID=106734 RepID=A0A8C0H0Q4_CHEAB|nr:U3 small nucleolar RNA-associated protein 18 homolog [Chelonoidis abingdonii]